MKGKVGEQWNKIFMEIFRSMSHGFLLLSPVSLTELCSFWYGLKDLFTLHKLAKKVVLDGLKLMTSQRVERNWIRTGGYGRFRFKWVKGKKIYTDKTQSKLLCETLSSRIPSDPTAIKEYNEIFNTKTFLLDWERVYSLPFKITKLREFQYKYFTESVTQISCSNLV